jgi:hypothetical protein
MSSDEMQWLRLSLRTVSQKPETAGVFSTELRKLSDVLDEKLSDKPPEAWKHALTGAIVGFEPPSESAEEWRPLYY